MFRILAVGVVGLASIGARATASEPTEPAAQEPAPQIEIGAGRGADLDGSHRYASRDRDIRRSRRSKVRLRKVKRRGSQRCIGKT